jgi:hypothetical protein
MDAIITEGIISTLPLLNERQARLYLANEAKSLGYGGVSQGSEVSGVSRVTITKGLKEIRDPSYISEKTKRIRKIGAGCKSTIDKMPEIINLIEKFIEPFTNGSPVKEILWTSKSTRNIEEFLKINN